ncbi:Eco57I restriction-modification methylase domain-containing protein [Corynebacterium lubricantis]|uniref:Eco57I restriction-modification methylase domain-containing protein n=1 Tax=Corynebacterium lubricantis TaxID=541095 RepID=UPI00036957A9|nr:DNA methyltransferase [Corynebacterium lubricantis]
MADFDSIINVEEFLSDHYFTADEVKGKNARSFAKRVDDRTKQWNTEAKEGNQTPWTRLKAAHTDLQLALSTLETDNPESVAEAHRLITDAFGYPHGTSASTQQVMRGSQKLTFPGISTASGAVTLIFGRPITAPEDLATTHIIGTATLGEKEQDYTVEKLAGEIFLSETPPEMLLIVAGSWVILAHQDTWALGRYIAVDLGVAIERNDTTRTGELAHITCILARENTDHSAEEPSWWTETISEAREHSVQVSEGLREAVKQSIEIIGNDVLDRHRAKNIPIDDIPGNELATQSLRYLYRILFLLFAEASPELNILPTGTPEYDEGYGLARLRDQILVPPVTNRARNGSHLYASLDRLFTLVDQGHDPNDPTNPAHLDEADEEGLTFRNLSADLFQPQATTYIDRAGLSNQALHQVLEHLLLTKETAKKDRGYISYATLGVTELGQVYEGLMSYTGFIAEEELIEVAPKGDAKKGSWVIPPSLASDLPDDSVVMTDYPAEHGGTEKRARRYKPGQFVYRQSSRDRERSASFYTPEVLTQFTVSQSIEVLEEEGGMESADDILDLTICEPAMGSGAFAVEAVRQLSEMYLDKKQDELGETIEPGEYTRLLQNVKAHIALHQVYGVDLNKTAVELAEISLWLDTMTADLKAPWFGLHLRHGNSLVGSRRATVSASSVTTKKYLSEVPTEHGVTGVAESVDADAPDTHVAGRIHHFLLPSKGWGAAADATDLKTIVADEQKTMKAWRRSIQNGFTTGQKTKITTASKRVEELWRLALVRWRIAEDQARRDVPLYGRESDATAKNVSRAQIEQELFDNPDSPYQRLRLIMNTWNALWFWPLTHTDELPDHEEWLSMLEDALGHEIPVAKAKGKNKDQLRIGFDLNWDELDYIDDFDRVSSERMRHEELLEAHPWLRTAQDVAREQAFFHWDLDFSSVMARGGFDLQVGNPPWVRPRTDLDALYSEHDPWFSLAHKPTQAAKRERRDLYSDNAAVLSTVVTGITETVANAEVLGSETEYPFLRNQQPDLYRGFMNRTWSNASEQGVVGLIHPESHFTEKKAASLRAGAYQRLRRHWQFVNELVLFDVHHLVKYGVHVYGSPKDTVDFLSATSLYHPQTVVNSQMHDGSGSLPGFKDDNGNWDLRPHRDRFINVDGHELDIWRSILEDPSTPLLETRMVYTVNTEAAAVLEKLAEAPRMKTLNLEFSRGWDESIDKKKGYFDSEWARPGSWNDVILQGPHLGVSTPMIKQPNPTMKHNQDWSEIDLEEISPKFVPATAYQRNKSISKYREDYGTWNLKGKHILVNETYRVAWRIMAATTGFRTLYPAIIPAGSFHINGITSGGPLNSITRVAAVSFASSIINDFLVRSTGLANILAGTFDNIATGTSNVLWPTAAHLYLRLNCLTEAYAPLWEEITGEPWTPEVPLRKAEDRREAQNEIDAIVALSLGVTADELCMIYRTQFPVMRRYDQEDHFDANGRKVPKEVMKLESKLKDGETLSEEERTWLHPQSGVSYTFEYPFRVLDREADLRAAYAKYEAELGAQG